MKVLIEGYNHFKWDRPQPPCPYAKDSSNFYLWMAGYELAKLGFGRPRAWLIENQKKGWKKSRRHGQNTKNNLTYRSWASMRQRCNNPKNKAWPNYGGRGISICDRWNHSDGFISFLADMGERKKGTSLERINVNGNYEPSNCKWATTKEQGQNKRSTVYLTYKGATATLTQWADRLDIDPSRITGRLHRGWSVERALSSDPKKIRNKTGYPGVFYLGRRKMWQVQFNNIDGKRKVVGTRKTPLEAYMFRVEYAKKHGIKLKEGYNFLDKISSNPSQTLHLPNMQLSMDFNNPK